MAKQNIKSKQGFTIIEVVLVLAIAGLIFLMVFVALPALQRSQRDTARRNDISRFSTAITQYETNNNGKTPWESSVTSTNFVKTYITDMGDEFTDPTGVTYTVTWQTGAKNKMPTLMDSKAYGTIYVYNNAKCDGESVVYNVGTRNFAIITPMETGAYYCVDNS